MAAPTVLEPTLSHIEAHTEPRALGSKADTACLQAPGNLWSRTRDTQIGG